MTGLRKSFYGNARFLVIAVLLGASAVAADQPIPDIPDPVGLGPRLALLDYLRTELKDDPPVDATYEQLVARYWLRVDGGAAAAEAYRLRLRLRDLGQVPPADADLATLRQLHATAVAQARAKDHERELELARAHPTQVVVVMREREAEPVDDPVAPAASPALGAVPAAPVAPPAADPTALAVLVGAIAIIGLGGVLLWRRRRDAPGTGSAVVPAAAAQTTRRIRSTALEGGVGERLRLAMEDLLRLLPTAEDGRIDDRGFAALLAWRVDNRNELAHPALRRFSSWFNGIISEGVLDSVERAELVGYCQRFVANEIVAVPPGRDGGAWRHEPASGHQLAYLLSLGLTADQCEGFSRGQACDLIERMYDEKKAAQGDEGRRTALA